MAANIDDIIDNINYIFDNKEIPKYTWIHLICSDTIIESIIEDDRVKIIYKDTELAGVPLPYPMIKIQINDRNIHFMSNKNLVDVDKNAIYLLFGGNSDLKIKVGEENYDEK